MKSSRVTDSQIMTVLKQAATGTPVPDLCREHGVSTATLYKWRGMDVPLMAKMRELEDENQRLKKMYVYAQMRALTIVEAITKI